METDIGYTILVVSPAKTYKCQRKRVGYRKDAKHSVDNECREVFAISEISINWDIRVHEKLSALAVV